MLSKIKILALVSLLFSVSLFAQTVTENEKIKNEIAALFKKADKSNLQNILTYKVDEKIGFVDGLTNKNILNPTADLSNVSLFKPIMYGIYKEKYYFNISAKDFSINVQEIEPANTSGPLIEEASKQPDIKVVSSKDGYKGFSVDSKGSLTSYSDLYYAQGHHAFNVRPFIFEGKYYAIATKKTGADEYFDGIIDTDGKALPNFNFTQKCLTLIKENPDDIWFTEGLCRDLKGSYVSFKGKVKLKDEMVGQTNYYDNLFKYNHNHSDDWKINGILDTDKFEWILKPQSLINILKLDYTSKKEVDESKTEERENVKMYFLVKEGKKEYYMDFKMKKYYPLNTLQKKK